MSGRFPARIAHALVLLSVTLTLLSLSGCGTDKGIDVEPVTGRVTYNGEPLEGALIMFKPTSENARVASGYTRDDGSFELATSGATSSGAMPGDYDVLISKVVELDAEGKPVEYSAQDYNPAAGPQQRTARKSMIPAKYNDSASPLLSATVTEGENDFEFNLEE